MASEMQQDDYVYRSQVNVSIDQLRLALETGDTGERIRLLNGALANTGNAIGQLAQFNKDGTASTRMNAAEGLAPAGRRPPSVYMCYNIVT